MEEQQQLTKRQRRLLKKQARFDEQIKRKRNRVIRRGVIWASVLIIIAAIIGGIIWFGKNSNNNNDKTPTLLDSVSENDHVKGNRESSVVLIEYSDFQCPACKTFYSMVKELNNEFKDDVSFVEAQEGMAGIDFAFTIGRDKFLQPTSAGLSRDNHQDLRDLKTIC